MKIKIKCPFSGLENCFIAGGAILSTITKTPISDWDIYPKSMESIISNLEYLLEEEGCQIVNYSSNAITLKSNLYKNYKGEREIVQLMILDYYDSAEKIFDHFDFTVCMAAYDVDEENLIVHDNFFVDVAARNLRVNQNTKYPHATLIRLKKYTQKGYTIQKSQMLKLGCMLNNVSFPKSWEDLESAIGGVYGKIIKLETTDIEYNEENVYKLLDEIDVDSFQKEQDLDQDTLYKMLKSKKVSEKELAIRIISNKEVPLLKINNGWVYYNDTQNKIYGDTVLFKNVDSPSEYNIKEYKNILIGGYILCQKRDDGFVTIKPVYSSSKPTIIEPNNMSKDSNQKIYLSLNEYEKVKDKNCVVLEVLVNSDDINVIGEGGLVTEFGTLVTEFGTTIEKADNNVYHIKANRFKILGEVKID